MAFKDLFIKPEEGTQSAPVKAQVNQPVNNHTPSVNPSVSVPTTTVSAGSIETDEQIMKTIWNKIVDSNRPGPDYLELKQTFEAMSNLQISNEDRMRTAFNILKASYPNFTREDIVRAIDFYINIVNGERQAGLKQLEELRAQSVDGVEKNIERMRQQADDLKRQYEEINNKISEQSVQLTQAKSEIELKNRTFISSIDQVISVLNTDKENVMKINF